MSKSARHLESIRQVDKWSVRSSARGALGEHYGRIFSRSFREGRGRLCPCGLGLIVSTGLVITGIDPGMGLLGTAGMVGKLLKGLKKIMKIKCRFYTVDVKGDY